MKTNIKMRVTPEQSISVQKICIANGVSFLGAGKVDYEAAAQPFLLVNLAKWDDKTLTYYTDEEESDYDAEDCEEIDADLFIRTNGTCEEPNAGPGSFERAIKVFTQASSDLASAGELLCKALTKNYEYTSSQTTEDTIVRVTEDQAKQIVAGPGIKLDVIPEQKGHPHAELMAEYAKDAAETDRPWERWEASSVWGGYTYLAANPSWDPKRQYRRKPQLQTVTMPDGTELPEPVREALEYGCEYFMTGITIPEGYVKNIWMGSEFDMLWLERGLIHRTKEDAKAWDEHLLSLTQSS